jgi:hypothetical protein
VSQNAHCDTEVEKEIFLSSAIIVVHERFIFMTIPFTCHLLKMDQ